MRTKTKPTVRRCSRCGLQKPLTEEFWYFHKSGERRGTVTGFCKPCHQGYCRIYDKEVVRTAARLARRRIQQRDWQRRKENYNPERYRVSVYEAMLAGEPTPRPSAQAAAS